MGVSCSSVRPSAVGRRRHQHVEVNVAVEGVAGVGSPNVLTVFPQVMLVACRWLLFCQHSWFHVQTIVPFAPYRNNALIAPQFRVSSGTGSRRAKIIRGPSTNVRSSHSEVCVTSQMCCKPPR